MVCEGGDAVMRQTPEVVGVELREPRRGGLTDRSRERATATSTSSSISLGREEGNDGDACPVGWDGGVVKGVVMWRRTGVRELPVVCVFVEGSLLSACRWLRMSLSATGCDSEARQCSILELQDLASQAPSRPSRAVTGRLAADQTIGPSVALRWGHLGAGEVSQSVQFGVKHGEKRLERMSGPTAQGGIPNSTSTAQ